MNLLSKGNGKIGPGIWAFNLPAVETCPGISAACDRCCYARRSRWTFPNVRRTLAWNLRVARQPHFTGEMVEEISRRKVRVLRLHSSGDFYDAEYVGKWIEILTTSPAVRAYAYTRSWRVPAIRPALDELVTLSNVRLWYSADLDTGMPEKVHECVRVAWLLEDADDPVPAGVNLVFRNHPLRRRPQRRIGLTLVCPTEQGRGRSTTCTNCAICWRPNT
jgi:hypothetical protein